MKTNKLLITFLFAFMLVSLVSSAPPFESSNTGGLQFSYSPYEVVKTNEPFYFHLHVINDTELQTNATTSCFVHLYTSNGEHSLQNNMGWDSNNLEFKLDIDAGNFTFGQHAYVIICNNTNKQIHEVNGAFQASPNGNIATTADAINTSWQIIILIIALIVFMVMGMIFKLDIVKIFFFVMAGLTLFLLVGIALFSAQNYLYEYTQYLNAYSAFYVIFAIVGGTAIIGLVIWFIYYAVQKFSKSKIGDFDED